MASSHPVGPKWLAKCVAASKLPSFLWGGLCVSVGLGVWTFLH